MLQKEKQRTEEKQHRCFSCGREMNEEGKKKEDTAIARRGERR